MISFLMAKMKAGLPKKLIKSQSFILKSPYISMLVKASMYVHDFEKDQLVFNRELALRF